MFSAIKRLAGKSEGAVGTGVPSRSAHQSMPTTLQRKFAKGVQYNMKIIIKGDRNVGKSCLFHRLQGQKFIEEYIPTEEIRVASIQWNYKATDDVVKVEVWDVVDRGRRRRKLDGLKTENKSPPERMNIEEPALDAEFLDVYKSTNGVIVMMDITKAWTFDYVQRELPKIPEHIPVIVLGNHCDMSHHRSITSDHVTYFIDSLCGRSAQVRYAESSMRNGFGLKLLHKFFNLPFLQLQRETLLKQLETNEEETRLTIQELDLFQDSDDADYDKFLDNLVNRRRAIADSTSATVRASGVAASTLGPARHSAASDAAIGEIRRSASTPGPMGGGTPIPVTKTLEFESATRKKFSYVEQAENLSSIVAGAGPISTTATSVASATDIRKADEGSIDVAVAATADMKELGATRSRTFASKMFGNKKEDERERSVGNLPIASVEDFVPDDGMLDRSFLDDNQMSPQKAQNQARDSDSDTETANPLVASYEDLSSMDESPSPEQSLPPGRLTENPLSKQKHKRELFAVADTSMLEKSMDGTLKRDSLSSTEQELGDGVESLNLNQCDATNTEAFDNWLARDSKWRQSPEGGEDVYSGSSARKDRLELSDKSLDVSMTSSNVHLELLDDTSIRRVSSNGSSPIIKEKKKHKEKGDDKEKRKKKKSKDKEKQDKAERKKKRSSHRAHDEKRERNEFEEFLNGSATRAVNVDVAYEAI